MFEVLANPLIQIKRKENYGRECLYIVSEHADPISRLTGKKTVDQTDLKQLEQLGFFIQYIN